MTTPDRPGHVELELGAHALGLLDETEARAVEQHLAACTSCRREWEELREMSELLDELPPEAFLDGPPDGDLVLQRTLRQIRSETGAKQRRRRIGLVAAAAVIVAAVLGGGVVVGRATAPESPPETVVAQPPGPPVTVQGSGPSGVEMSATITPAMGWVRLTTTVSGIPSGEVCQIVVVAEDGTRAIAGTWVVPATGEERGVTLDGSAAVAPDDVAAVLVENTAGRQFVQVDA
ncbi:MAG TPA: zf-HC2 domain-containing protein [Pseudonocardia sp.]|nr:zf-HC2 domain-containing protein [Pseudonocardia sp.]